MKKLITAILLVAATPATANMQCTSTTYDGSTFNTTCSDPQAADAALAQGQAVINAELATLNMVRGWKGQRPCHFEGWFTKTLVTDRGEACNN